MSANWQRVEQIAGIVFMGLIALGCIVVLRPFVTAILWAAILCYATWPLYRRIEGGLRGRKNLAAGLMTALLALVFVLPFAVVGFTFADNVARLAQLVQGYRSEGMPPVPDWVDRLPLLGGWLRTYWQDLYENTDLAAQTLKSGFGRITPTLLRWSLTLGEGILQLALSVFIAFFFYRDGPKMVLHVDRGIKRIAGDYAHRLVDTAGVTVKSVVYGLLGTALAQGIVASIGFAIAGIPAPILLGLLTFMLSLVPAGPPLVWVPATVWLLARGELGWGIFMGVWGLVGISGIDNVVRPVLINRGTTQPLVLTLLGVGGGLMAFGFIGIFIGPTLLAAGYSVIQQFLRQQPGEPDATASDGPPDELATGK